MQGIVVHGSSNPRNHLIAHGLTGGRIGYEYSDRELSSIGERNETYVIGGARDAIIHVGGSGFVSDYRSLRQVETETRCPRRAHPCEQQRSMFSRRRRMIAYRTKKPDGSLSFKPVSILKSVITMERTLSVLEMKPADTEGSNIVDDTLRSSREAKQDVSRRIVTQRDGHLEQGAERYFNAGLRVFVLKWTVGIGENQVGLLKGNRLIQGESSLFHLVQDRQTER